jgi:uncharacterized membrane protein
VAVGLLVGLASSILMIACFLGLIVLFLGWWAPWFAMDKNTDVMSSIRAGYAVAKNNVGSLLGIAAILTLMNIVGGCLCGLGLFVTYPITLIASAWTFRIITGSRVS